MTAISEAAQTCFEPGTLVVYDFVVELERANHDAEVVTLQIYSVPS